jgi:hypothetical protein
MQKLIYRNPNGEEIDFTSGDFGVTKWSGFSKVDMDVQSQQVPFHDGSVFLDALLGERELSVTVAVNDDNNLEKRYRLKREMIHCLNPKLGEGELIYTNDYTSKKIVCVPDIPEFDNKNMNDSGTMKAMCSFTASNPYWEDVEETIVSFNADNYAEIENKGDCPCSIQVKISSYGTNQISLHNFSTEKKITVNGNYENIIINTDMGKKIVNSYNNKFTLVKGELGKSSEPPLIAKGIMLFNSFYSKNGIDYYPLSVKDSINAFTSIAFSPELDLFLGFQKIDSDDYLHLFKSKHGIEWEFLSENENLIPGKIFWSSILQKFILHCFTYPQNSIYTSADGINWEFKANISEGNAWHTMAESDSVVCIGCSNGYIITTTDGETWNEQVITDTSVTKIIWIPSYQKFFASFYIRGIFSSLDGINWTEVYSPSETIFNLNITFDSVKNRLILLESSNLKESYDKGITWNLIGIIQNPGANIDFIPFLNIFYTRDCVFYDPNYTTPTNDVSYCFDMVYSKDKKLLCGWTGDNTIILDKMGNISISENFTYNEKYKVAYGKGFFWLCAINKILRSNDGIHWDVVIENISFNNPNKFYYAEEINAFIIVGNSGLFRVSFDDCLTWENHDNITNQSLCDVICFKREGGVAPELYVTGNLVRDNQSCYLVSNDGHNWVMRDLGLQTSNPVYTLTYCDSLDMIVFASDSRIISWKGLVWTEKVFYPWSSTFSRNFLVKWNKSLRCFLYVNANNENRCHISFDAVNFYEIILPSRLYQSIEVFEANQNFCVGGAGGISVTNIEDERNIIDSITEDSDMNFNLDVGKNLLRVTRDSGYSNIVLSYKQKYLGV